MNDKIALVTGGSRGLGRSAALHLAGKGIGVVLTYHSRKAEADAVVAEIERMGGRAAALQLDAGDTSRFPAFADEVAGVLDRVWGRRSFSFLVNNAGNGVYKSFEETTEADLDSLLAVHLKGAFFLTQRLLPLIEDGGRIVNVSSGLARFALPGYSAYGSVKGALEVLTRYLAAELGPRRIAVNTVAPGAVETDFGGGVVRDDPELNRSIASATAMGRVGLPDDIGGAIASLLAGETGWITAQRIEVSGGQHI